MRPFRGGLFADENIRPTVVEHLKTLGYDAVTVVEVGLKGAVDSDLLAHAAAIGRILLTQDRDFGALAIRDGLPFLGIVFLRPGNLTGSEVAQLLSAITSVVVDVEPPFIIVAERRGETIRVRRRQKVGMDSG